ncbi:hypothetical protein [Yoonia sp. R2-816]|uniref:hypothetical protein n=1 Tax=Yoonia sp. R2-816 TaxID=3342638 RepID=UPI0037262166
MPLKQVDAEIAFKIDGLEIEHVYRNDMIDFPMEYWFSYDGVEFDIRDLPVDSEDQTDFEEVIRLAVRSRVGPFVNLPNNQVFTVRRLVDAYQEYYLDVEASSAQEALELSKNMSFEEGCVIEFDATRIEVHDGQGNTLMQIPE